MDVNCGNSHMSRCLDVMWRKSVREIWNLPYTTHCYLLPILCDCNCIPFSYEICRRSLNFLNKCVFSDVEVVRSVAHYAVLAVTCYSV